jgi:hypothetical protein
MTTDLTQHPPRSLRTRLGGYALLPRMLDKGRAELAGKNGDYHFACPLDQRLLEFLGLDPEPLKAELATGKGDGEILAWIKAHQRNGHTPGQIAAWSDGQERRQPDAESKEFFDGLLRECGPQRTDIETWADVLDLDDYVSYGGKA